MTVKFNIYLFKTTRRFSTQTKVLLFEYSCKGMDDEAVMKLGIPDYRTSINEQEILLL